MIFREAFVTEIPQLHTIRMAVKENALNNPALVNEKDYVAYLTTRGKGWVCERGSTIVGFDIGDLVENNVWALFIQPGYEGKGIGQQLLSILLDWYFSNAKTFIWLSTAPGTRADQFYRRFGWKETGRQSNGEVRFEMNAEEWRV